MASFCDELPTAVGSNVNGHLNRPGRREMREAKTIATLVITILVWLCIDVFGICGSPEHTCSLKKVASFSSAIGKNVSESYYHFMNEQGGRERADLKSWHLRNSSNTSSILSEGLSDCERGRTKNILRGRWVDDTQIQKPYELTEAFLPRWTSSKFFWAKGQCAIEPFHHLRWVPNSNIDLVADRWKSEFCTKFQGKNFLFVGDSIMGQTYTSFVHLLGFVNGSNDLFIRITCPSFRVG